MMIVRKVALSVVCLFLMSSQGTAAQQFSVTGKVLSIATSMDDYNPYTESGSGLVAFYIEGLGEACGNGHRRIAIGTDNPIYETVLTLMLSAKLSGKTVTVEYLDTCTVRSNSWDFAYMYLNE